MSISSSLQAALNTNSIFPELKQKSIYQVSINQAAPKTIIRDLMLRPLIENRFKSKF
jgi:hypothetical protein